MSVAATTMSGHTSKIYPSFSSNFELPTKSKVACDISQGGRHAKDSNNAATA